MRLPNQVIKAEDLTQLLGKDFESFCRVLLDYERNYRHAGAELEGPTRQYVGDAGSDLLLTTLAPPRIAQGDFEGALTEDDVGRTAYLCKTGANWSDGLVGDCKRDIPLDVISTGGLVIALVNLQLSHDEREGLKERMSREVAAQLSIDHELLGGRIRVRDANDLHSFYSNHPLGLDAEMRAILGIQPLSGLMFFEEWRRFLAVGRSWPDYASDVARQGWIDEMRGVFRRDPASAGEPVVIWVYGAPGVGKSRLVAEALASGSDLGQRTLVAPDFESGFRAAREFDVPRYGDVILVIDECPKREVQAVAAAFVARSQGGTGTLVLIGPQDGHEVPAGFRGIALELSPLTPEATRVLIERELGVAASDPTLVQRVRNLTEGYPWFAVLLSRALKDDPTILPEGSDDWDAAKIAIAGPKSEYGDDSAAWEGEVLLRAKAMLAIVLTEDIDWRHLSPDVQEKLGAVFEEKWSTLLGAAERCWQRGIVRMMQNWRYKYVTPNNLARLVATNLLKPPTGLGHRIRTSFPEWCGELYRRLERFEVRQELLENIAEEVLRPFLNHATLNEVAGLPLTFLARHQPKIVARLLRQVIEETPLQELIDRRDLRRPLVFPLAHICRRRQGFHDAEAALFRLALAENETWANNATGLWRDLFLAVLSLTHVAFGQRLELLVERLADPTFSSQAMLLLLSGLERAIGNDLIGPGYSEDDTVDGPWLREDLAILRAGKLQAWQELLRLTAHNALAHEARRVVSENLRAAANWGIGTEVFTRVSQLVMAWSPEEEAAIREQVRDLRRYHSDLLDADESLRRSLHELSEAATPGNLHARMLDTLGNWFPWDDKREDESYEEAERRVDLALAADALAGPAELLVAELEWLDSETAVRAVPFAYCLGELDENWLLFESLEARAKAGFALNVLPAYLAGRNRVVGIEIVDEILRRWRDQPALAPHTLLTTWRVGASDERVGWIIEDLNAGRVRPDLVGCLTMGSWGPGASPVTLFSLAVNLAGMPEVTPRVTALNIVKDLQYSHDLSKQEFENLLASLVTSLAGDTPAGFSDLIWEMGAKLLIHRGRTADAVEAAMTYIGSARRYGADHYAWRVVDEAVSADALSVWFALASLLEERPNESFRVIFEAQRLRLADRLPADSILDWVGMDQHRSILAAELCSVHSPTLSPLARGLIVRFGSDSPSARVLAASAGSTPEAVSSLASFSAEQLRNALEWANDEDPVVKQWATRVADSQRQSYEHHAADEEFEQRLRN